MKKYGVLTAALVFGCLIANADITISYLGVNIKNGVTAARTYVGINPDGSGYRDSGANYPGNDSTYPAITGSVSSAYSGYIFSLGIGGGQFNNTTNVAGFGVRTNKSAFTLSTAGVGLATGIGGVDMDEGFLFRMGTDGLPDGSTLQVTTVTLGLFQTGENEHAVILNNSTGDYMIVDPDADYSRKVVDVTSLNIHIDAGQAQIDPNNVNAGHFTVMCAEPEVATGWRLESVSLTISGGTAPDPADLSIATDAGSIIVSTTNLNAAASNTLQYKSYLSGTSWSNLSTVTGVTATNWTLSATNQAFFRLESTL